MRAKICNHSSHTPDLVSQSCETNTVPSLKRIPGFIHLAKIPKFHDQVFIKWHFYFHKVIKNGFHFFYNYRKYEKNTSTHFTEMSPCINPLVYLISAFFSSCTKYINVRFEVKILRLPFLDCFIGFTIYNDHLSMQ